MRLRRTGQRNEPRLTRTFDVGERTSRAPRNEGRDATPEEEQRRGGRRQDGDGHRRGLVVARRRRAASWRVTGRGRAAERPAPAGNRDRSARCCRRSPTRWPGYDVVKRYGYSDVPASGASGVDWNRRVASVVRVTDAVPRAGRSPQGGCRPGGRGGGPRLGSGHRGSRRRRRDRGGRGGRRLAVRGPDRDDDRGAGPGDGIGDGGGRLGDRPGHRSDCVGDRRDDRRHGLGDRRDDRRNRLGHRGDDLDDRRHDRSDGLRHRGDGLGDRRHDRSDGLRHRRHGLRDRRHDRSDACVTGATT